MNQVIVVIVYDIDDLIMISALQRYAFCPRQCALILHDRSKFVEG